MTSNRINPDSGVIEHTESVLGGLGGTYWVPTENDNGNIERINTGTGVHEEQHTFLGGLFSTWDQKK